MTYSILPGASLPDLLILTPTAIPPNLEPQPYSPDGHSRSLEPDASICLACEFPTPSCTHHMPHA